MARALGSHSDLSSAAHLPAAANNGTALTLFRVTGFEPSVEARCALLPDLLQDYCPLRRLEPSDADALWKMTATGSALRGPVLWRLHVPPAKASDILAKLEPLGAQWTLDWGGEIGRASCRERVCQYV